MLFKNNDKSNMEEFEDLLENFAPTDNDFDIDSKSLFGMLVTIEEMGIKNFVNFFALYEALSKLLDGPTDNRLESSFMEIKKKLLKNNSTVVEMMNTLNEHKKMLEEE